MDTDSLFKRRVSFVCKQPDTWRGNTIEWYAKQEHKPWIRIVLIIGLTVFVMAHTFIYCILIKSYIEGVSAYTDFD
jgi:hypothetical protein